MATPVTYIIYMTDAARVATLQAQYPTGIQIPPNAAAAAYGVPAPGVGTNNLDATGGVGIFQNDSVGFAVDLSASYGTQTFTVTYPNQTPPPSTFPNPYPVSLSCYWVGFFMAVGNPGTTSPNTNPRYQGARRWCEGFEVVGMIGGNHYARDASRTAEGIGFCHRNTSGATKISHVTNPTGGTRPSLSWERFYIRLRTLPSADDNMWSTLASAEGGTSLLMYVSSTGTLKVYSKGNAAFPGELLGTTAALTVGQWYRIDMRIAYKTAANAPVVLRDTASPTGVAVSTGTLRLYVNGSLSFSATAASAQGLGTIQLHSTSFVGRDTGTTNNGLECDIDDWCSADEVSATVNGVTYGYPGFDLTTGSHVQLVRGTGFDSAHNSTAWNGVGAGATGAYQELNHNPASDAGATSGLTTTTVSAIAALTTDYARTQWGLACVSVGVYLFSSSAGTITLTANTNSRTNANAASSTWLYAENLYSIASGVTTDTLPDISPLVIKFQAVSGAGTTTITALIAQAEHIGVFGNEDTDPSHTSSALPRIGIHNAPYANISVSNSSVGPVAAVRVSSGIYVGNNIGQDIFEQIGANWFWVRSLSGSSSGVWYSGMVGAHTWLSRKFAPEAMVQAKLDSNLVARLGVAGSALVTNQSAASYQYIAVSDYAMRYLINGAFAHTSGLASAVNSLIDSVFTPDCVFAYIGDLSSATNGHYFRGPGHTSDNASRLDTSEGSAMTFAAGSITSKTALHTDAPETAFSAWRKLDGVQAAQWFDVVTYTGDGNASRDITVALNGQSPLFAIGVPHNGSSFLRDASHTGTNSVQISNGANSTTAIIGGGTNKVTVGVAMNALGIVYELFVIAGGTGSWSANGVYTAAVEAQRTGGPWAANPAVVPINPVTLTVPAQWRIQRFDLKPRTEERA